MEIENSIEECLVDLIEDIGITSEASGDTTQKCFFDKYNELIEILFLKDFRSEVAIYLY